MKELVQSILQELRYSTSSTSKDYFSMLFKESEDYFIVAEYKPSELAGFFTNNKTKSIIEYFQTEKEKNPAINKNTSLVILVKSSDLAETLETHRNNIFNIEEDEYTLRKYVIVYTQEALDEIAKKNICDLNEIIKDPQRFSKYQEYDTRYEDQGYFLAMQLFVKLPPLSFDGYESDFESVRDRIDSSIGSAGSSLVKHILETTDSDVKSNRSKLLEVENDSFDKWLSEIMTRIDNENS